MSTNVDVMSYDEGHYFNLGTSASPDFTLGTVITQLDENSNPTEVSKQYITDKTKTNKVTGFDDEFPITQDLIKNEEVSEYMYNIFRNRKTGTDAQIEHVIAEYWNPVSGSSNEVYARKQLQSIVITSKVNNPGENINFSGSLKAAGDFVYGKFNTSTKTFTEIVESV